MCWFCSSIYIRINRINHTFDVLRFNESYTPKASGKTPDLLSKSSTFWCTFLKRQHDCIIKSTVAIWVSQFGQTTHSTWCYKMSDTTPYCYIFSTTTSCYKVHAIINTLSHQYTSQWYSSYNVWKHFFFFNYLLKILHRTFNNLTTAVMCTVLYTENDTFK